MSRVRDVMDALERIAPKRFAASFDKVGLQVGDPNAEVSRAVVSLDRSLAAVQFAAASGAQMLVSHHPLIFEPVGSVLATSHVGRTILALARHGVAFAAAHTNWDSARGGISDALAKCLDIRDCSDFGSAAGVKNLKLVVFAPAAAAHKIIDAASEAGAGVIGEYSRCAFLHPGTGTFRGSAASHPTVGTPGHIESVDELRIEMVLPERKADAVARAVCRAHPYEEPAIDFFVLRENPEKPAGRVGSLPTASSLQDLVKQADRALQTRSVAWGDPARMVKRLAVMGGAGDFDWRDARGAGADTLLTGEVKHHVAVEAVEEGFSLLACGHYATEQPGCIALRDRLASELPEVEWLLFTPEPGSSGRPLDVASMSRR